MSLTVTQVKVTAPMMARNTIVGDIQRSITTSTLQTAPTSAQSSNTPTYPIQPRDLHHLKNTKQVTIWVGPSGPTVLASSMPLALLQRLCSAMADPKVYDGRKVYLQDADRKAVSWVMGWIWRGGRSFSETVNPNTDGRLFNLLGRLQAIQKLGISGRLERSLKYQISEAMDCKESLPWSLVRAVITHSPPGDGSFRGDFARSIVWGVLNGKMAYQALVEGPCVDYFDVLEVDIRCELQAEKIASKLRYLQRNKPLETEIYDFIIEYTNQGDALRSRLATDFVNLRLHRKLSDEVFQQLVYDCMESDHGDDVREVLIQNIEREDVHLTDCMAKGIQPCLGSPSLRGVLQRFWGIQMRRPDKDRKTPKGWIKGTQGQKFTRKGSAMTCVAPPIRPENFPILGQPKQNTKV
ncbi:hypothetical protein MMC25_000767 [Agyrium rufum]|nr:hypothetical protein [Agyrium rufum]